MSNAPVLAHSHIFGLNANVSSNVLFVDENIVLYPAGHTIIIYNVETHEQRFVFGSEGSTITALALSPNRRFVAVAEKGERAVITIFDVHTLRKRKVLNSGQVDDYVWVSFSSDGKKLLSLGGAPDFILTNWHWEKIRPLHSVRAGNTSLASATSGADGVEEQTAPIRYDRPVRQCSFCPSDPSLVVAIGKGVLSLFQIVEDQFETMPLQWQQASQHDFTCHTWIADTLIVGTKHGQLFTLSLGELRSTIDIIVDDDNNNRLSFFSMASFRGGFVVGAKRGTVYLFDLLSKSGELVEFGKPKVLRMRSAESGNVTNMNVSPSEEMLALTTSQCESHLIGIANSDILKAEEMKFEPLLLSFHSGPIVSLDVSVRKPLIVTCSSDRSVRVWNYVEKTVESVKQFEEMPLCVSLHPSGFHVLVGFSDKLRLMNLLMDDIRTYKEFSIKNAPACKFSNGGHLFAVVHGSIVLLYNTYSGELVTTLRGHNQKVFSVHFSLDDTRVITAGSDGAIYEFVVKTGQREHEYVQKGCKYTSAIRSSDGKIYAVGSDRVLKELADSSVQKELDAGLVLTHITLSHPPDRMLFSGTSSGVIRSFKFPLNGNCQDYQCHAGAVSRVCISHDDSLLFSAGVDGCLAMFEVRDRETRRTSLSVPEIVAISDIQWSEEVLVTRSDLDERNATMNELKNKVDELTLHNEYQIRLQEMNHLDQIKEVKESFQVSLEDEKRLYEQLKDEKQDLEMDYEERIKKLEDHHAASISFAKQQHQDKIMHEVENFHALEREMKEGEEQEEAAIRLQEETHQDALDAAQVDLEEELEQERERREGLEADKDAIVREFKETKRQLEQDTDSEIQELKEKFDATLSSERETTLRLKGENGIMKKRFSSLSNDIEDQKEEIKLMEEKEAQLHNQISTLKQEIEVNKAHITQRDTTIGEKERKIYELKKRNQELEKHKFVLDFQIKELKRQIEPRENKIADMQEQEQIVDQELESFHKQNGDLRDTVESLKKEILGKQQRVNKYRKLCHENETNIKRQQHDISRVVQFIQQPETLREEVEKLHEVYVHESTASVQIDPAVTKEYVRQKMFLEKSVGQLKNKLSSHIVKHNQENRRVLQENVELIKEINDLRREFKILRQTSSDAQQKLERLEKAGKEDDNASGVTHLLGLRDRQRDQIRQLKSTVNMMLNGTTKDPLAI